MQAQSVWNTWRRIMREQPLQQLLFDHPADTLTDDQLHAFGLAGDELQAARAYGLQADRAQWFVLNYRFRLANSFLNALETGAPLVLRALLNKGLDVNQLGCEFLEQQGWKDYGPMVYAYCAEALDFLAQHPDSENPAGLRALIGLEATVVALMRDLARLPPYSPQLEAQDGQGLLRRSPYARHFSSRHRLSTVLRDKKLLGRQDLALLPGTEQEHFVVYLPQAEASHKYGLLPARAMEILQALDHPCTRDELPGRLQALGFAPAREGDTQCLQQLRAQRLIAGAGV